MTAGAVDLDHLARRFPLLPRPRPSMQPLQRQLDEIADLARTPPDHPEADSRIAAAHNRAALIASNCGLPDLARTLCWKHHHRYTDRQPWTAHDARLALEPLVNLARLHIRANRTDTAIETLDSLLTAASNGGTANVDGYPVELGSTIATQPGRATIRRWLWTVTLAEGLRALAQAGRWPDALTHAQQHRGIGQRLLDGRQVAILAHLVTGDHKRANQLIDESDVRDPWEHAIAATLAAAGPGNDTSRTARTTTMVDRYLCLDPDHRHIAFTVRLGLTVVDLAGWPSSPDGARAAARIRSIATITSDAYIAREILAHPTSTTLTGANLTTLRHTVHDASRMDGQDHGLENQILTVLGHSPPLGRPAVHYRSARLSYRAVRIGEGSR